MVACPQSHRRRIIWYSVTAREKVGRSNTCTRAPTVPGAPARSAPQPAQPAGSTGSRRSGVATGARPLPRCPGCPPCLRRAGPDPTLPRPAAPRTAGLLAGRPAGRLRLRLRGRPVRARRLRGVRGVPARLPPQRLQLDPQRLDQHRLLGQPGGLLGHQRRQLGIGGRRLGHGRKSNMIKHRTPAPTRRRSAGGLTAYGRGAESRPMRMTLRRCRIREKCSS